MKSNDIQRGVGSRKERNIGDAPDLSRVARMAGAGSSKGVRRRRRRRSRVEDEMGKKRSGTPVVLTLGLMFGTLLLIGVACWMWIKPILDRRGDMVDESKSRYVPVTLPEMPELTAPGQDEIRQKVREGLQLRDVAQVEKFYRLGDATPQEVIEFLGEMDQIDGKIVRYDSMGVMDANRMPLEGMLVTFDKDGETRNRIAVLTPDDDGVWKIDFAAFQRRSSPGWEEFLDGSAEQATSRVYVAPDTYYNGSFSDEREWRCYGLAAPDVERLMFGYCKRNSPQDIALGKILQRQRRLARATVNLEKVEGGGSRQFEIKQVVAEDWVVGDMPFEDQL